MKQHKYIEVQPNDKKFINIAHEGQRHKYKDEFNNIPTDFMTGNVDSIDMSQLFFNTNTAENQQKKIVSQLFVDRIKDKIENFVLIKKILHSTC